MFVCRVLVVDDNTHIHRDFKKIVDTVDSSGVWGAMAADPLGSSLAPRPPAFEVSSAQSGEIVSRLDVGFVEPFGFCRNCGNLICRRIYRRS